MTREYLPVVCGALLGVEMVRGATVVVYLPLPSSEGEQDSTNLFNNYITKARWK